MNSTVFVIFLVILPMFLMFGMGIFVGYNFYYEFKGQDHYILGLWFSNHDESYVFDYINKYGRNEQSRWICINIKDRTEEEILNTCQHELGHEIFYNRCLNSTKCANFFYHEATEAFAQRCEYDISKCMEMVTTE